MHPHVKYFVTTFSIETGLSPENSPISLSPHEGIVSMAVKCGALFIVCLGRLGCVAQLLATGHVCTTSVTGWLCEPSCSGTVQAKTLNDAFLFYRLIWVMFMSVILTGISPLALN
jgi:hypothetical protein